MTATSTTRRTARTALATTADLQASTARTNRRTGATSGAPFAALEALVDGPDAAMAVVALDAGRPTRTTVTDGEPTPANLGVIATAPRPPGAGSALNAAQDASCGGDGVVG